MKVTLIHNPDAGNERQPSGDELVSAIRRNGHDVVYQSAKDPSWHEILKRRVDVVAVAGGDGIVGQVAKRLIGIDAAIAILPMGTANNIATTLGLTETPFDELVSGWKAASAVNFDVGVASGPWGSTCFVEGMGLGLFTQTMYRLKTRDDADLAHATGADQKLASVLEILSDRLQTCPTKSLKLILDGVDLSGDYLLLEVMNIKFVGPNLYLAPNAEFNDGVLDIVLLAKGEEDKLSKYLSDFREGLVCSPDLPVHRGQHLQLEWEGSVIHIDDEIWPADGSTIPSPPVTVDVTVHLESLRFLSPA